VRIAVFTILLFSTVMVITSLAPVFHQLNLEPLSAIARGFEIIEFLSEVRKIFIQRR
jgi:hypothetical protein